CPNFGVNLLRRISVWRSPGPAGSAAPILLPGLASLLSFVALLRPAFRERATALAPVRATPDQRARIEPPRTREPAHSRDLRQEPARRAEPRHQLAHLLEARDEIAHVVAAPAAAARDPARAALVDQLRSLALVGRHRADHRLDPNELRLLHLIRELA